MRQILVRSAGLAVVLSAGAWAGALLLQVSSSDANPEAKSMNAVMVAESTACMEPAKSVVTANLIQMEHGQVRRTPLEVVALKKAGSFAVIGKVPPGSLVELAVSNPDYKNYQPRVLVRNGSTGIEWASMRRFFATSPAESDMKAMLGAEVD